MAVTHPTAVRNGIADYVVDLIDGGVGANGRLEFQTSGDVEVAIIGFSATAFGAATLGVATANSMTDETNATGGTIAKFKVYDEPATGGTEIFAGAVGTGGSDINLSTLSVTAGDTVTLTSLTYTAPS